MTAKGIVAALLQEEQILFYREGFSPPQELPWSQVMRKLQESIKHRTQHYLNEGHLVSFILNDEHAAESNDLLVSVERLLETEKRVKIGVILDHNSNYRSSWVWEIYTPEHDQEVQQSLDANIAQHNRPPYQR